MKKHFLWIRQRTTNFSSNNNNTQSLKNPLRKSYRSTYTRLFKAIFKNGKRNILQ